MNKYDTVYVPDRNGIFKVQEFYEDYHEWVDVHSEESLSAKQNIICMTIEELSELWNAGYRAARADLKMGTKKPALDFEEYLTSKGITL